MTQSATSLPGYRPFRLEITGDLRVRRFHTGTVPDFSSHSDSPILRDSNGRPYLPGTSLRGVLRSHLERSAPLTGGNINRLFGITPRRGASGLSLAGRLTVCDALSQSPCHTELRDHVRLEPKWGAASDGGKFDQEIAAGDITWRMSLIYEGESDEDDELLLLREAVRALEQGDLTCGAKSGSGYGRLQLLNTTYLAAHRSDPASLAAWLNSRLGLPSTSTSQFTWPTHRPHSPASRPSLDLPNWIELRLQIQFDGVFLSKRPIPPLPTSQPFDPKDRSCYPVKGAHIADAVFAVTGNDDRPFLPGSSLRGVLRHQALRIENLLQLDGLVDDLFGSIKKDRATQTETGRKGAIEVSDGDLIGTPCPIYLDHVALDRITGFAADAKKFSTCGLASPAFSVTLRVHFGLSQLRRVAFLGFLLRDLQDGLLWAGSGVTRGFGHIHGASITAATLDLSEQFEIPENLARQAQARPGRRRLTLPGPVAFHDLDWVWQRAEEAWREALPTEAA